VKYAHLYFEMMNEIQAMYTSSCLFVNHIAQGSNKLWAGFSTDLTIEQCMMRALRSTSVRGINESVRTTWILSVHKSAAVQNAFLAAM